MEILAFVLSTIGTICICVPPLLKGKNMKLILLLVFSTNVLIAISYFLTGAFNGGATCCIGAAQTIINYFLERKNKPIPAWLIAIYAGAFIVANLLVFAQLVDLIALIAALTFIFGISQKNGKRFRLWTLANSALWMLYDILTRSYGPLSTHTILLVTTLTGMLVHDRKQKDGGTSR